MQRRETLFHITTLRIWDIKLVTSDPISVCTHDAPGKENALLIVEVQNETPKQSGKLPSVSGRSAGAS